MLIKVGFIPNNEQTIKYRILEEKDNGNCLIQRFVVGQRLDGSNYLANMSRVYEVDKSVLLDIGEEEIAV